MQGRLRSRRRCLGCRRPAARCGDAGVDGPCAWTAHSCLTVFTPCVPLPPPVRYRRRYMLREVVEPCMINPLPPALREVDRMRWAGGGRVCVGCVWGGMGARRGGGGVGGGLHCTAGARAGAKQRRRRQPGCPAAAASQATVHLCPQAPHRKRPAGAALPVRAADLAPPGRAWHPVPKAQFPLPSGPGGPMREQ